MGSLDLAGNVPFNEVLKDGMGFPALANVPGFGLCQIILFAGLAEGVAMPSSEHTEAHRTFQVVSTEPCPLFQVDTLLPHKLRTQKSVTANLILRSRTDVLPCLVLPVPGSIP